ncbi:MAG: Methicillin resistance protein [Actinomycetia bacterium]|nr:Methicillin resistance protein [Actinomycetes bacterium]
MGVTVERVADLSPDRRSEITVFLDCHTRSHPFQYPQFVAAAGTGDASIVVTVGDRGRLVLSGVGMAGRPYGRLPLLSLTFRYGPVTDSADALASALAALTREARARRTTQIDAHPLWPRPEQVALGIALDRGVRRGRASFAPVAGSSASLRVTLREPDVQLATFRQSTRYEIRRAEKAGVGVVGGTDAATMTAFAEVHRRAADGRGYVPEPADFLARIGAWLRAEPGRGTVLLAQRDGDTIGGLVALRAGATAWYLWGGAGRVPGVSAGHLLQARAMAWAWDQGCAAYDLSGGVATTGVAAFKRGFGGMPVEYVEGVRLDLAAGTNRFLRSATALRQRARRSGPA